MIEIGLYFYFFIALAILGTLFGLLLSALKDWAGF